MGIPYCGDRQFAALILARGIRDSSLDTIILGKRGEGNEEGVAPAEGKPLDFSALLPETLTVCLFSVNLIHDLLDRDSLKTG